jgi:hypothetical protein
MLLADDSEATKSVDHGLHEVLTVVRIIVAEGHALHDLECNLELLLGVGGRELAVPLCCPHKLAARINSPDTGLHIVRTGRRLQRLDAPLHLRELVDERESTTADASTLCSSCRVDLLLRLVEV